MAGGTHSPRQRERNRSMASRTQPPGGSRQGEVGPDVPVDPRPCWVLDGSGDLPGHVLAWQRQPRGGWQAVVVITVAAAAIRPRSDPQSADGSADR